MQRTILKAILATSFLSMGGAVLADSFQTQCTESGNFFSSVDVPNSGLSGFTGPYGEICISLTGQTATVTADSFYPPYRMGDGNTLALEVNSTSFTAGTVTGDAAPINPNPHNNQLYTTSIGTSQVDGFGDFNFHIDSFDGFTHSSTTLTFTLTNTDLSNLWQSATDVLTFNANDFDAAMHIFVSGTNCGGSPCTGFAGEGTGTNQETPEPGSVALLGIGILGVALTRRRPKGER